MLRRLLLLLLWWVCAWTPARALMLFANVKAWDAVQHAGGTPEPPLTNLELHRVFLAVWDGLRTTTCPELPDLSAGLAGLVDVRIDDALLVSPSFPRVLGWASRTERLVDRRWQGMLSSQSRVDWMLRDGFQHLGTLRVARDPPNGWFRGNATACQSRFRLEDVLLHEILHLLGVSSTLRQAEDGRLAVGLTFAGICYPGEFDAHITSRNGTRVVDNHCAFTPTADSQYFVRGVRLYVPEGDFSPGTTMSHLLNPQAVLSPHVYACAEHGANTLTADDCAVLGALGVACQAREGNRSLTAAGWRGTAPEGSPSRAQTPPLPDAPSGCVSRWTPWDRSQAATALLLWSCWAWMVL